MRLTINRANPVIRIDLEVLQNLGSDPILPASSQLQLVIAEVVALVGDKLAGVGGYALWLCAHSRRTEDVKASLLMS